MHQYPGYSPQTQPLPNWKALTFHDHANLAWIGFDSNKRIQAEEPYFVVQSSASLAQQHLETQELQSVGNYILQKAAENLAIPWLKNPQWMQVHCWHCAFPHTPLYVTCLSAKTPLHLVSCGDWCGGNLVGGAMVSRLAAAVEIDRQLHNLLPENIDFLEKFV
jgi:predicted NAD/FAD-dependent oxidoreductase